MAWIESHQSLAQHPKTRRLARALEVSLPTAIGHLHLLWWWTLDYAEDGELVRYTPEDIADACQWEGDAITLWEGLISSGFVDANEGKGCVHDWDDYAGKLVERRRRNRDYMRASRVRHVGTTLGHVEGYPTNPTEPTQQNSTIPTVPENKTTKRRLPKQTILTAAALMELFNESDKIEMTKVFPGINLEWEAGKCVDWHNAKGGSGNWKLAYKNWLGNAKPSVNGVVPKEEKIIYRSTPDADGHYAPGVIPKTMLVDPRIKRGL